MNPWVSNPLGYQRQTVRAEAPEPRVGDAGVATLRLYDPIDSYGGPFGVSAKEFVQALDELPDTVAEIDLRINCPGGDVWEGLAILNALRAHPALVTAIVEGIACSAASFIAAGCDELEMAPNSEIMVHRAWGMAIGNAEAMQKMADDLDHEDRNLAAIYAAKTGGTVDEWLAIMSAETWFSADEAVAEGLADRVGGAPATDQAKNRFDRTIFNLAGRWAPAPQASATPPSPSPTLGQKGGSMPELTPEHMALLGLPEDASADDITAKLTEHATPPEPVASVPDGHVVIPEARLKDLEVAAQRGVEAAETLRLEERTKFLDSVRAKYAPANRAAWEKEYDRDPAGTRTHFASAPDILPIEALGTNGGFETETDVAFETAIDRMWGRTPQEVKS